MAIWAPKVLDRYNLRHGVVFVVWCDAAFDRRLGQRVQLEGATWEVLGWDDHRTALSPYDGETIALLVCPASSAKTAEEAS